MELILKFKNQEIESLGKFLFNLELSGKQSRMRTRFINILDEYLTNTIQQERIAILKTYAMKDEQGEILVNESGNEAILVSGRENDFYKELDELLNEDFIIEETETFKEMILIVGNALLNCDIQLNGQDAVIYDRWCLEFEKAIERYGSKEDKN